MSASIVSGAAPVLPVPVVAPARAQRLATRRLLFVNDKAYRVTGTSLHCSVGYNDFFVPLRAVFAELHFLGRQAPEGGATPFPLGQAPFTGVPYFKDYPDYLKRCLSAGFRRRIAVAVDHAVGRADLVFLTLGCFFAPAVAAAARRHGKPLIIEVIDDAMSAVRSSTKRTGLSRYLAMAGAGWIEARYRCVSRHVPTLVLGQHLFEKYSPRRTAPIECFFENLMDASDYRFERPRFQHGTVRLLSIGRFEAMKSLDTLVAVVAQLKRDGRRVQCRLVGYGVEERALRRDIEQQGLGSCIEIHGFVPFGPGLFAHYDWADVFVLPSVGGEGVPRVLIEAMGRGCGVVASKVCGVPSIVRCEYNGLLVRPRDVAGFTAAVRRLCDDATLRARLLANAQAFCLENTRVARLGVLLDFIERCLPMNAGEPGL